MNKRNTVIVLLIVIAIALVGWIYWNKAKYTVDLNLTPEQKLEYETKVSEMDRRLQEAISTSSEQPDIDLFIEKARYQEYLGRYGDAIDTLLESFKFYENTSAGWNNIAKLYEKIGDYRSAIIFYNKLINGFSLNRYYLDIAKDYFALGKYPLAQEAYGRYAQLTLQADEDFFNLLNSKLSSKK